MYVKCLELTKSALFAKVLENRRHLGVEINSLEERFTQREKCVDLKMCTSSIGDTKNFVQDFP